jgi:hypothetical protein
MSFMPIWQAIWRGRLLRILQPCSQLAAQRAKNEADRHATYGKHDKALSGRALAEGSGQPAAATAKR